MGSPQVTIDPNSIKPIDVTIDPATVRPIGDNLEKATPNREWGKEIASGAGNFALGAAKQAGAIGMNLLRQSPVSAFIPPDNPESLKAKGPAQEIGKGVTDVASFLAPIAGEDAIALKAAEYLPQLGRMAAPLARMLYNSLTTGEINKLQGGKFSTGAAWGAGTGALNELGKIAAPGVAEMALRVGKADKAYGKTVGETVLDKTTGVSPEAVGESAQNLINQLTPKMETLLQNKTASSADAVKVIDDAIAKATKGNNKQAISQLNDMKSQLTTWQVDNPTMGIKAGDPIPPDMPAQQLLDLKRGLREQWIKNWNPTYMKGTRSIAAQSAHAADASLDVAGGPEFPAINQEISSLIPAVERGKAMEHAPTLMQRVGGRVAARTGALAAATGGAALGYQQGGVPGAIGGAVAGAVVPEAFADPTAQMLFARALHSGMPLKLAQALVLSISQGKTSLFPQGEQK